MTTSDRIAEYVLESQLTAPSSFETYGKVLRNFDAFCKVPELDKIDPNHCRSWLADMLNKGKKKSSVNKYRTVLSSFFKWAVMNDYMPDNPLLRVRRIIPEKTQKEPFTEEDFRKLLKLAPKEKFPYWTYALIASYHTGMRLSDAALLKWENIDWTKETIKFIQHKTRNRSKIAVEVPIEPREFYPVLKGLWDNRNPAEYLSEYVFPEMAMSYLSNKHHHLSGQFKRLCKRAGINKSFHILRHTFCSDGINAGIDSIVMASMTGHTDPRIFGRYAHVSIAAKRNALQTRYATNKAI